MAYVTVEVPFKTRDNKKVILLKDYVEEPWVAEFVERFRHCFVFDDLHQWFVYEPKDE